jgi:hypothetical protein
MHVWGSTLNTLNSVALWVSPANGNFTRFIIIVRLNFLALVIRNLFSSSMSLDPITYIDSLF